MCAPPPPGEKHPSPRGRQFSPVNIVNGGLNPFADGLLLFRLTAILRRVRPAAYLSWTAKPNIYGALAASLCGVPAFPNVSGLGTAFIKGGWLRRLMVTLYRAAFRKAPVVFFQNQDDRCLFIAERIVTEQQARVLPGSGVDLERFEARPPEPKTSGEIVFLFVGRLLGDKGLRELAEAARQVKLKAPQARFQLLGFAGAENRTAIEKDELDEWVSEGLVEYLGAADDVRPHLARADAVILPSYREGMSRSLLEAAAVGRPLLASDVPGNRELVTHGVNGMLFPVRSAEGIAEACLAFMALPFARREEMGQAARRMVEEQFSEEQVFAAYADAIAQTLKRP